jgi:hypothetical protein
MVTESKPVEVIRDAHGRKQKVVMSYHRYCQLMEDLHDLAVIADRRDDASIPLTEMEGQLRRSGVLPG